MRSRSPLLAFALALGLEGCAPNTQRVAVVVPPPPIGARRLVPPPAPRPRVIVVAPAPPPPTVVLVPTPPPDRPNGQPGWWPCMLGDKLC